MYQDNNIIQESFNPIDFGFEWTEDWYEFDYQSARGKALKARNARAKELKEKGYTVKKYTSKGQLMKRGGIGSGHPEIHQIVNVYNLIAH